MGSFNHRIVGFDDAERTFRAPASRVCRHGRNRKTSPEGCGKRAEFVVIYDYVTGRAGRISDSRKSKCREHAEVFAKRHGCPMPGDEKEQKPLKSES